MSQHHVFHSLEQSVGVVPSEIEVPFTSARTPGVGGGGGDVSDVPPMHTLVQCFDNFNVILFMC